MSGIKLPGFTAESSIYQRTGCYQASADFAGPTRGAGVLPQRKVNYTGPWWLQWYFELLCDAYGGGMQSNPDGSVSCNIGESSAAKSSGGRRFSGTQVGGEKQTKLVSGTAK